MNKELKKAAKNVLEQLTDVIVQMKDEDFTRSISTLNHSTIGQHIRHTLEFFTCLADGYITGTVNYDKRKHDKAIEENRDQALTALNSIQRFLQATEENVTFCLEINYEIDKELNCQVETNLDRELVYNIEHAIHHMAIVRIGLNEICPYVSIPQHFGVANSTVKYKKEVTKPSNSY
ncbi:DinB family protein [Fulvivirgaceae bacterium BMA10]|uniref:DinB family protein n=1 Tax=Splendidivirga corallicola TaxID=3051826 RepID=A0ABT8KV13_9BACT|nr:DinB family protein [Fulvivirgaceae bacterium BMA10]